MNPFLNLSRTKKLLIAVAAFGCAAFGVLYRPESGLKFSLSIDSALSGFLALTGFIFTARTFITFKVNEVVYENKSYRERHEKLRKANPNGEGNLYAPLKELDDSLCFATNACIYLAALLALYAVTPNAIGFNQNSDSKTVLELLGYAKNLTWQQWIDTLYLFVRRSSTGVIFTGAVLAGWAIVCAVRSLNTNIKAIICHWEAEYTKEKEKEAK